MVKFLNNGQGYFVFAEFEKSSTGQSANEQLMEFTMRLKNASKRLPVAKNLTKEQYDFFLTTYAKHNRSMGLEERKKYSLISVTKIRALNANVLAVYYADGNWWHYTSSGEWY